MSTIQFARWVFLDGGKRVIFTSNYDGSLDSYMDDFINKVGLKARNVTSSATDLVIKDELARSGWRAGRAEVQELPPPTSVTYPGLV